MPAQATAGWFCPMSTSGRALHPPPEHSPNQRRARRQPDEHGRQGAAPADETAKASVVRASSYPPVVSQRKPNTAQTRSLSPANPLVKPLLDGSAR